MLQKTIRHFHSTHPFRAAAGLAAAVALVACLLLPGTAEARNLYGAIAYSFGNGAVGYSYNHRSRGRAESDAVSRCRRAGGAGCKVVIWFANSCAALAVGPSGYGSFWHANSATAQRNAMRICRQYGSGCGIKAWSCTSR